MDRFFDREFGEMPKWGEQAVAIAEEVGDAPLEAAAMAALVMGLALAGRIQEAEEERERTVRLGRSA